MLELPLLDAENYTTPILDKRDWGDSKIGRYLIKCLYQNQN